MIEALRLRVSGLSLPVSILRQNELMNVGVIAVAQDVHRSVLGTPAVTPVHLRGLADPVELRLVYLCARQRESPVRVRLGLSR